MAVSDQSTARRTFRHFFVRGLAILLPTILTIWILIAAYGFVRDRIAAPINAGIREIVVRWTDYPPVDRARLDTKSLDDATKTAYEMTGNNQQWLLRHFKRQRLQQQWRQIGFPMDVIGLLIAIVLIYFLGRFVGSYIGASLYRRGEELLSRTPVINQVYPYVKQVTDFLVGSEQGKLQFKRVVAVEYPRKGLWSVGLVTGDAMTTIQQKSGAELLTIFVPSSPTPFTGYVVTARADDTVDLNLTIEQALKFTISGGVLTPAAERVNGGALEADA